MRLRNPNEKKMNILRLLPLFLLLPVLFLTGWEAYRYLTGAEESALWLGLWGAVSVYMVVRSVFAARKVFVWDDDGAGGDGEN